MSNSVGRSPEPERVEIRLDVHEVKPPGKAGVLAYLNSTVLAALVTALVGGVAAQCVIQTYQQTQKVNEVALVDQKERISAQRATVESAGDLLADAHYQAINLHSLTLKPFDPAQFSNEEAAKLEKLEQQRQRIAESHNRFLETWLQRKQRMAIRLAYDFSSDQNVLNTWRRCVATAEQLVSTATQEHNRYRKNTRSFKPNYAALEDDEAQLESAMDQFTAAIEAVRARK